MTPDQQLETAMLEGKLEIIIQSIGTEVDTVFERRMKRYEAYSQVSPNVNPLTFNNQGFTRRGKETNGILEEGNETETLG